MNSKEIENYKQNLLQSIACKIKKKKQKRKKKKKKKLEYKLLIFSTHWANSSDDRWIFSPEDRV